MQARDFEKGGIAVTRAWARATPSLAKNGAAYVTISARGNEKDRLIRISTPAARKAELHTTTNEGNIMRMRPVEAVEVTPGMPVVMRPGALHVMLMGLHAPLKKGRTISLTLTFEKAGELTVEAAIHGIGARSPKPRQVMPGHHGMPTH